MDKKFILIDDIPTKILVYDNDENSKFGQWNNNEKFNKKQLIIMIPGNPGEIEYYTEFLNKIYNEFNIPIIGISHCGHNIIDDQSMIKHEINSERFGLNAQIIHKAKFIEENIESSTRIILIGHSIGTYIILELLNRYQNINKMIDHSILLFPTIDRIIDTDSGRKMNLLLKYFINLLLPLVYLFNFLLNKKQQQQLIYKFFQWNNYECITTVIKSSLIFLDPYCIRAITLMALEEFNIVKEPNINSIKNNSNKLSIYYSDIDQWAPIDRYYKMIKLTENCSKNLDINLCLKKMDHAFPMYQKLIDKVSKIIINIIKKIFIK